MAKFAALLVSGFVVVNLLELTSGLIDHLSLGECMNETLEVGRIASLTLTPYPVHLQSNVSVTATVRLFQPVRGNIRAEVEIRRKFGFLGYLFKIPCISNFGSCSYPDVCGLISGEHKTTTSATTSATTTNSPVSSTDNFVSVTGNPASASNNPVTVTDNSVSVTDNPTTVANNPVTVTDNSVSVTSDNPATVSNNPVTVTDDFVPVTDNPVSTTEIPVSVTRNNPVSDSSNSVVETESPVFSTSPVSVDDVSQRSAFSSIPPATVSDLYSDVPSSSPTSRPISSFLTTDGDVIRLQTRPDVMVGREVKVRQDQPASVEYSTTVNDGNVGVTDESYSTRSDNLEVTSAQFTDTAAPVSVVEGVQSASMPGASVSAPAVDTLAPVSTEAAPMYSSVDTSPPLSSVAATAVSPSDVDASLAAFTGDHASQSLATNQETSTEAKPSRPDITTEMPATSESVPGRTGDVTITQTVTDVSEEPRTTSSEVAVSSGEVDESECPTILQQNNIPCRCPFEAGEYTVNPTVFKIPDLEGIPGSLVMGDYRIKISFFDGDTGEMLMCQQIEASISNAPVTECTGTECIIG